MLELHMDISDFSKSKYFCPTLRGFTLSFFSKENLHKEKSRVTLILEIVSLSMHDLLTLFLLNVSVISKECSLKGKVLAQDSKTKFSIQRGFLNPRGTKGRGKDKHRR